MEIVGATGLGGCAR